MVYSFHAFPQGMCIVACQPCADTLPGADNISVDKIILTPAEMAGAALPASRENTCTNF